VSVVDFVLIVVLQGHTFSIICAKIIIKNRRENKMGVQIMILDPSFFNKVIRLCSLLICIY
jgi:hypothetical protein